MIKSEEEERCLHQRSVVPANPLTLRPSVRRHGGATYADEELIRGFLADDRASRRDGTTWTRRYRPPPGGALWASDISLSAPPSAAPGDNAAVLGCRVSRIGAWVICSVPRSRADRRNSGLYRRDQQTRRVQHYA